MLAIDECDKLGYWQMRPDLMLWATVLGGYTAREKPLRWWFAEQLRGSRVPTTPERWTDVQQIAEQFLPFKHGHGEGCQHFWNEAGSWLSNSLPGAKRVRLGAELCLRTSSVAEHEASSAASRPTDPPGFQDTAGRQ